MFCIHSLKLDSNIYSIFLECKKVAVELVVEITNGVVYVVDYLCLEVKQLLVFLLCSSHQHQYLRACDAICRESHKKILNQPDMFLLFE